MSSPTPIEYSVLHVAADAQPAGALAQKLRAHKTTSLLSPENFSPADLGDDVLLLWSPQSAREESFARLAGRVAHKRMIHLRMHNQPVPAPYHGAPSIDLTGWRGEEDFPGWRAIQIKLNIPTISLTAGGSAPVHDFISLYTSPAPAPAESVRVRIPLLQGAPDASAPAPERSASVTLPFLAAGPDVFVSYKSEDRAHVQRLVNALRESGYNTWWDQDIASGAPWEDTIERQLAAARVVVVVWTAASAASTNVKAEAREALKNGRLVQVYAEACEAPLFFREHQGLTFAGWDGAARDPRFQALLDAIERVL